MGVSAARAEEATEPEHASGSISEVFLTFLKLGCTSFGGPIAHLGYFRDELVVRRRWLDDRSFGELVGLCQFLPGPASSQTGFALGLLRAGPLGGFAAWIGFTLPSALLMFGFALIARNLAGPVATAAIHGLKVAAVAIVAQALLGMARKLTPDARRIAMAIVAAASMLIIAIPAAQIGLIALGAVAGLLLCRTGTSDPMRHVGWTPSPRAGMACLAIFAILLVALPALASISPMLGLSNIFYRAGALVFGGGHVVLPLLRAGLVPDWMGDNAFLAGYGAAQAVPGPLFTLSAYLGAITVPGQPIAGAALALVAIFAPGLLLIAGALPFRRAVAGSPRARAAIAGVNATVVGILGAALYDPLWITGIGSVLDAVVAIVGCVLLVRFRPLPLLIVLASVAVNVIVSAGF